MKNQIKKIIQKSKHYLARFIFHRLKLTYIDEQTKEFIKHNQKVWKDFSKNESKTEILFELNGMQPNIISYSYLANILAKKYNAKIKAYSFGENNKAFHFHRKIYKSFNVEVFAYKLNKSQLLVLEKLFDSVYSSLSSKKDVFKLNVSGVWFGDLIYDSHLMSNKVPTIDINDSRFKDSLRKALYQYIYWRDYFDNHNVKAINVSHCAYLIAIPMRIAIQAGIPAYQINAHGCYYMTKERLWAYTDFYDYPMQFLELTEDERKNSLKIAKERIERRFAGEVGVDMTYSTKSAYTDRRIGRVLSKSNRIKILIATHCFFDSPNGLGRNLFPDFYEWITLLGNISEKTDYDWYIKTHPDFLPENIPIIEEFISKYPKFTLIPAETSHHQIIEEEIDFALTVHGTIGFEYAVLGVPVINASMCNPHIAYNFNIHPKSLEEYEKILMNLANQKPNIKKQEIYEYYYMKNIKNDMENWLFDNYAGFIDEIGEYSKQFGPVAYQKFLEEFSAEKHERIICSLNDFIESKDYCFQKRHLNHKFDFDHKSQD